MILAGDIGGTKTLLALFENEICIKKQTFLSTNYAEFEDLLNAFLSDCNLAIDSVCLGVAGPIVNGDCETTNLPWFLSKNAIEKQVKTPRVRLLNDLEAAAWGVLALPESDFVNLNPTAQTKTATKAVIAAGTGLGEAIIFHDGQRYHVLSSEGGHCDFAPQNAQEIALLHFMQARFPEHVSYERLISGVGLVAIYDFLKNQHPDLIQESTEMLIKTQDCASVIGQQGVLGKDELCVNALALFCRLYGAEAGNLALKCLPYGGIYLAGGIAAKILPALQKSDFLTAFSHKGRYQTLLENISINVCLNSEVGLLGAYFVGKN